MNLSRFNRQREYDVINLIILLIVSIALFLIHRFGMLAMAIY